MEYLEDLKNKLCVVNGSATIFNRIDTDGEIIGEGFVAQGYVAGIFSGYYDETKKGEMYYQIQSTATEFDGYFYITGDLSAQKQAPKYGRSNAQKMLDDILRDNKYIMENLEVCALIASQLPNKNIKYPNWNITPAQMIAMLHNKLRIRENTLVDEDIIESKTTAYNKGAYEAGQNALNNIVINTKISGIGAVPVVVVYIAVAVVSVAVGAFIYWKLHNMRNQANYDLKLSNEFLNWLKDQSPETTKIVLNQLKATGDSAYASALKTKGGFLESLKSAGNLVKLGLIGAGCFFVYTQVDTAKLKKQLKTKFK